MKPTWQKEWPKERGYWWFFGKISKNIEEHDWYFVKVRGTAIPGSFCYITDGRFLYKEEGAEGHWTKVVFPEKNF